MGSITRSVESSTGVTMFTVVGEADALEILNQIVTFLREAPTMRVIWDIRNGTLSPLSPHDLRMIVERAGPLTHVRAGGRTAIVCSRAVDFGLSRMFQTFAELAAIPFEIRVARDLDDARRWIEAGGRSGYRRFVRSTAIVSSDAVRHYERSRTSDCTGRRAAENVLWISD